MRRLPAVLLLTSALLALTACGSSNDAAPTEAAPQADAQGRIRLSAAQTANIIMLRASEPDALSSPLSVPGLRIDI